MTPMKKKYMKKLQIENLIRYKFGIYLYLDDFPIMYDLLYELNNNFNKKTLNFKTFSSFINNNINWKKINSKKIKQLLLELEKNNFIKINKNTEQIEII